MPRGAATEAARARRGSPGAIGMSLTLAQFHKHLGGDALKPVYLLAGEEHLLLLEAADALRARARALG